MALGMRAEVSVFRVCTERAESKGGQGLQEYVWVWEKEREGKSHVCLQHGSRVAREIKGAITLSPRSKYAESKLAKVVALEKKKKKRKKMQRVGERRGPRRPEVCKTARGQACAKTAAREGNRRARGRGLGS